MQLGYLSARAQTELIPSTRGELIRKYITQYRRVESDPELVQFIQHRHHTELLDRILDYLDWREEETEQGSRAIYFMTAPVPLSVHEAVRKQRTGFLDDRVLLRFALPPNSRVRFVGENSLHKPTSWWEAVWRASLKKHASNRDVLWLEDIPHAFIISPEGLIPASALQRVDESIANL